MQREKKASSLLPFFHRIGNKIAQIVVFYHYFVFARKITDFCEYSAGIYDVDGKNAKIKAYNEGKSEVF